jgi:hypothetical protein
MAMEMASVNTPLEPSVTIVMPGMIQAIKRRDKPSTTVMISKRMIDWMNFLISSFDSWVFRSCFVTDLSV